MKEPNVIRIEFFGVPRMRAGVAETSVAILENSVGFRELIQTLADRYPALAKECFNDGSLAKGVAANLGGDRFVTAPGDRVPSGSTVLIFSSDAGG